MRPVRPSGAGGLAALVVAGAALGVGSAATPAAGDATAMLTPELRSDVTGCSQAGTPATRVSIGWSPAIAQARSPTSPC